MELRDSSGLLGVRAMGRPQAGQAGREERLRPGWQREPTHGAKQGGWGPRAGRGMGTRASAALKHPLCLP